MKEFDPSQFPPLYPPLIEAFIRFSSLEALLGVLAREHPAFDAHVRAKIDELHSEEAFQNVGAWLFGELESGLLMRPLFDGVFLSAWAIYEQAIRRLPLEFTRLNERQELLSVRRDLLLRASAFYGDNLVELFTDRAERERIQSIEAFRHALVHCNGRIAAVTGKPKSRLLALVKAESRLSEEDGYLILDLAFTRAVVRDLARSLRGLEKRLQQHR